jgi:hypothetical protein
LSCAHLELPGLLWRPWLASFSGILSRRQQKPKHLDSCNIIEICRLRYKCLPIQLTVAWVNLSIISVAYSKTWSQHDPDCWPHSVDHAQLW